MLSQFNAQTKVPRQTTTDDYCCQTGQCCCWFIFPLTHTAAEIPTHVRTHTPTAGISHSHHLVEARARTTMLLTTLTFDENKLEHNE